ncbi:hypothetical protein [Poseidonocella sp. HB161398]|uniref:hypothetical protein n=1 Tax=Poseidonocella sp. HB161398 TaxID=2320855 RepID=UPI001109F9F3|nr:hypothetical protein [Poseidonocella sp. HB161398]
MPDSLRHSILDAHVALWDPQAARAEPADGNGRRYLGRDGGIRWKIIPRGTPGEGFWDAVSGGDLRAVREAAGRILLKRALTPPETGALWREEDRRDPYLASALFTLPHGGPSAERRDLGRMGPDFIVIGSGAEGAATLYDHICRHPKIMDRRPAEIGYFTLRRHQGEAWYRQFFAGRRDGMLAGEASASYFDRPLPGTPGRIAALAPGAHLFLILADPVRRAIEEYYAAPPDPAGPREELTVARLRADLERGAAYLQTGFYDQRLPLWQDAIESGRLSILARSQLEKSPTEVAAAAWKVLGLPEASPALPQQRRAGHPAPAEDVLDFLGSLYRGTAETLARDYGVLL